MTSLTETEYIEIYLEFEEEKCYSIDIKEEQPPTRWVDLYIGYRNSTLLLVKFWGGFSMLS